MVCRSGLLLQKVQQQNKIESLIENTFFKLEQWRGIVARYAENTKSFLAAIHGVFLYGLLSCDYAICFFSIVVFGKFPVPPLQCYPSRLLSVVSPCTVIKIFLANFYGETKFIDIEMTFY